MADLIEFGALYGCADDIGFTGDALQYSGLLPRLYAGAPANVIDAGGDKISLDDLDNAVATALRWRQTRNDPAVWFMGIRMKQVVEGLQTKVSMPIQGVVLGDGKIEMPAYYRRPIYETDYVSPASVSTSPAITATLKVDSNAAIPAGTYTYQMSSVTAFGEQAVGTASAGVAVDGTHTKVDLSWTADPAAKLYLIWRKLAAGAYYLVDIIPALTYDANGIVNGTKATYTDAKAAGISQVKPLLAGEEHIVLANVMPQRGGAFLGKIDDMGRPIDKLVSFVELARTKDSFDYFLKAYMALRLVYPNVVAEIRHCKLV
jgi:hypothetical protein